MGEENIIAVNSDLKIEQLVKEIVNCPAEQVILRIAPNSTLLNNEINLRLIKFYAEEEDKNIIIYASDPSLIALSQRLGISTISERAITEEAFQYDESQKRHKKPKQDTDYSTKPLARRVIRYHGGIFPVLLMTFFTFILAIWWFLQPKATVIVYPKEQYLNFRSEVLTGPDFEDRDLSQGKIPAKLFKKICTLEVQSQTTGRKIIGVTPATGKVTVINSTEQPLLIPKNTVFTSKNGIRFTSDRNVLVPKKSTRYQYGVPIGEEYGRADIPITAEVKGTSGNLPAKQITKVEGKFQRYVTVVNLSPTTKGEDKQVAVVTLDDVKKGEAEARDQMAIAGPEEAAALIDKGYLFLPQLTEFELIRVGSLPEIGETGNMVKTKLEYQVSVLAPSQDAIHKFLLLKLNENMPPNFQTKNNEVSLVSATALAKEDGISIELVARGKIRGILDQNKIKNLIKGKSIASAKKRLIGLNEVADFKIESGNRRILPAFGFQIRLILPAGAKEHVRP